MSSESVNTLVAAIRKNQSEELRVELARFKGGKFAAMRVFAPSDIGGVLKPTRQGLTVSLQLLPKLLDALRAVQMEAEGGTSENQSGFDFQRPPNKQMN